MIAMTTFKAAWEAMLLKLTQSDTASLMLYRMQNNANWYILDMSSPEAIADFYSGGISVPMLTLNRLPLTNPPTVRVDFPQAHVHGFMPLQIIERFGHSIHGAR